MRQPEEVAVMNERQKRRTRAQFEVWGEEIERRAAVLTTVDREVRFAALQHVDELKILHATARASFAALTESAAGEQDGLEEEFTAAWNELAAAVDRPLPR